MSTSSNNPIQFNQNSSYNITPTGTVKVIPYQQDKVNDEAAADSKNYSNKFFDEYVYQEGDRTIKLTPEHLKDIKRENTKGKHKVENVFSQTYTSYIHVDSSQRVMTATNIYDSPVYNLPPYPISFTNKSSQIVVNVPNNPFKVNDRVVLSGIASKNLILHNVVMVKKNSLYVRIFQQNHGITFYGLFDPSNSQQFQTVSYVEQLPPSFSNTDDIPDSSNIYYIFTGNSTLDYTIGLANVLGNDVSRSFIGNIPTNFLNTRQTVYLLF